MERGREPPPARAVRKPSLFSPSFRNGPPAGPTPPRGGNSPRAGSFGRSRTASAGIANPCVICIAALFMCPAGRPRLASGRVPALPQRRDRRRPEPRPGGARLAGGCLRRPRDAIEAGHSRGSGRAVLHRVRNAPRPDPARPVCEGRKSPVYRKGHAVH